MSLGLFRRFAIALFLQLMDITSMVNWNRMLEGNKDNITGTSQRHEAREGRVGNRINGNPIYRNKKVTGLRFQ